MTIFSIQAPAKVNLCLHITGKRNDGYHLLESLVVRLKLTDIIEIEPSSMLTLRVKGEFAAMLEEDETPNLALSAANVLRLRSGCSKGAAMTLYKHIPVGAGLGGGSADAAASLQALRKFWRLDTSKESLNEIALKLGSDVSVCMNSHPQWMRGVGEKLTPAKLGFPVYLLLVNPRQPLSTQSVFRAHKQEFTPAQQMPEQFSSYKELAAFLAGTQNDLEAAAIQLLPVIQPILHAIRSTKHCGLARMSGSGSTCFGLYETQEAAEEAQRFVDSQGSDWWSSVTEIIHEAQ